MSSQSFTPTGNTAPVTGSSRAAERIGQGLTYLVVVLLLADGAMQLLRPPFFIEAMAHTGFQPHQGPVLAVVTLLCAIVLAIPKLSILGAILVTGFLGGAIAVHVRIGEIGSPEQIFCILLGLATWGGLYFRDAQLRALLPFWRRAN